MRKEIFDLVRSRIVPLPNTVNHPMSMARHDLNLKRVHSGTTVMALFYDKGILFAGDKKTSSGFSIVDQDKVKLYQIASHSGCLAAGLVSDIQALVRNIEETNGAFVGKYGYPLSVEGQVNYIINEVRYFWQYGYMPLDIQFVLGGFDMFKNSFQIFEIAADGFKRECFDYAVIGSGTDYATSKLEENKKKLLNRNLSKEEATEVAVRAIYASGKKDLGTSDIRVACPDVAVIDREKGFHFLDSAVIRNVVVNLIKEEE